MDDSKIIELFYERSEQAIIELLSYVRSPLLARCVGRILRTFKIKKNVEVTDNGKIII